MMLSMLVLMTPRAPKSHNGRHSGVYNLPTGGKLFSGFEWGPNAKANLPFVITRLLTEQNGN